MTTHAWLDVSAGVAGDMVLAALIDAGADLAQVQQAIDSLVPGSVKLSTATVNRGGQRGLKLSVEVLVDDPPHRQWSSIRAQLEAADLHPITRDRALATFGALAQAEGRVHGVDPDQVHFHEVGALDSIADVVGACEALRLLGVDQVTASPIAVGAGRIRAAHGDIPVPVPAVAQLILGWPVFAAPGRAAATSQTAQAAAQDQPHSHEPDHAHGHSHDPHDHAPDSSHSQVAGHSHQAGHHHGEGELHHHGDGNWHRHGPAHDRPALVTTPGQIGELATPTGVALVRALASHCEPLPALTPTAVGVGAGGKDFTSHPNVVRVVIGQPEVAASSHQPSLASETLPVDRLVELATNVDDFDPRLWPGVLAELIERGAKDAWLSPIVMKKGRPAHTLHALVDPGDQQRLTRLMLTSTSALGVRAFVTTRVRLERGWITLQVAGQPCRIKVGHDGDQVVHATAEFADLAAIAARTGTSQYQVAQLAAAAAVSAGLVPGAELPVLNPNPELG